MSDEDLLSIDKTNNGAVDTVIKFIWIKNR